MVDLKIKAKTNINRRRASFWISGAPGTPVYNWREDAMRFSLNTAKSIAPVNNPLDAVHRGGKVGTYRRGLQTRRTGNQYGRGWLLSATAAHSIFVEDGRRSSNKAQYFSSSRKTPPGPGVPSWKYSTRARLGQKVIQRSIDATLRAKTS